jgi:hypothetical protein
MWAGAVLGVAELRLEKWAGGWEVGNEIVVLDYWIVNAVFWFRTLKIDKFVKFQISCQDFSWRGDWGVYRRLLTK